MKRFSFIISLTSALVISSINAQAHDFSVSLSGGGKIFFNVTDSLKRTVEVTFEDGVASMHANHPQGILDIPSVVKDGDKFFFVTSIGPKAFSGAKSLESISLPENLTTIGEFAFEGCSSLESIEFSKRQTEIKEGAFFGCKALKYVTIGSQWKMIDMSHFRWSENLDNLEIPAAVADIRNLKSLRCLANITVREQNKNFASSGGLLYSKDKTKLYSCPVSHVGEVNIEEGTEVIINDAFKNCTKVTDVCLPSTLRSFSFAEFRTVKSLKSLRFMSRNPIMTAVHDDAKVFCLLLESPEQVAVIVPKEALQVYRSIITVDDGRFESLEGKTAGKYGSKSFATAKNIRKSK